MWPIETDRLSKIYKDRRRRPIVALENLDLQIGAGEILGFLGPNGAGKSTTIKILVGQIRASAGSARLFGETVSDPAARRRIGYLPENPSFYDFLTGREYLNLVGRTFGMSNREIDAQADQVLELLDLRAAECRPIRGYSKGMVQRLGLAQTLLHDPDLYILDEPMSGLDPVGRALVKQIMIDLRSRGKTVFFSTHVTADVEAVCDRVAVIVSGKLQKVSLVSDLLEKGIEGYVIQLAGAPVNLLERYGTKLQPSGGFEVFVPRADLKRFMSEVAREGGDIQLIEPRRRNLEQFFLEIVQRHRETG